MSKKFVSSRWTENSVSWLVEKRGFDAQQRGLCIHCYGVGKLHSERMVGDLTKSKPCNYCRATGRNLDLEARSYEVHRERIATLSFSQMIREYCQLKKKIYSIDGYQPYTTDEERWLSELKWRLSRESLIGTCGGKSFGSYRYLPFIEDVLFRWECRLHKRDKELFRYVWERTAKVDSQAVENAKKRKTEERITARNNYRTRVKYADRSSRKWEKRRKILFPNY